MIVRHESRQTEGYITHLRLNTFRIIIGASPFISSRLKSNGRVNSLTAWHTRKRRTAMMSCAKRKNSGTSVAFSTHLFLQKCQNMVNTRISTQAHAMTI